MDFHISLVGLHIASFEEEGVMGNPEHLAKLKEGVEAWNAWRGKTPDIMPDRISIPKTRCQIAGI